MVNKIKYNCVFGGGGVRGLCHIGSVKALEELNIELNAIAGSSVGAVFSALYAIGYGAEEIKDFFMDFNVNMFRDININIFDADISLSKGEVFLEWLREKIEKKFYGSSYEKGKNTPVKFKDIDRDLYILTLDINTNTPYIFSKENTPDEEIALAVRTSAGMPGLMKPIVKDDNILVDGDLMKTRPAYEIFEKLNNSNNRLLEFRLEGTRDGSSIKNPSDYLNSVISTIWYLSTEYIYDSYHCNDRYDFVINDSKDVIIFDFTIDKTKREELIDKGYKTTKYYFEHTIIDKKKKIREIYIEIKTKLLKLGKEIIKSNAKNSLYMINDILSDMYENTKYIDISVYEGIKELKQEILSNIKHKLIFKDEIKNSQEITKKLKFLINTISERVEDIEEYIENICKNF